MIGWSACLEGANGVAGALPDSDEIGGRRGRGSAAFPGVGADRSGMKPERVAEIPCLSRRNRQTDPHADEGAPMSKAVRVRRALDTAVAHYSSGALWTSPSRLVAMPWARPDSSTGPDTRARP